MALRTRRLNAQRGFGDVPRMNGLEIRSSRGFALAEEKRHSPGRGSCYVTDVRGGIVADLKRVIGVQGNVGAGQAEGGSGVEGCAVHEEVTWSS